MIQATGKVAHSLVEALKNQPIALPVVIVNLMCMAVVGYTLYSVAARSVDRDKLLSELVKECTKR